jgi:hypothetical protein
LPRSERYQQVGSARWEYDNLVHKSTLTVAL